MKQIKTTYKRRNYGILTDVSKEINYTLGDRSGRTVSMRTAHGIIRTFDSNMHENDAEDIAHGAMVASAALLMSKNSGAKACGLLLALGLFACYQNGRK